MKALYFEYSSDEEEIFDKLSSQLFDVDLTDNKTYWLRPFQDRIIIKNKDNDVIRLKISLSPTIFNYLISDEKKQEEIDKTIEKGTQNIYKEWNL